MKKNVCQILFLILAVSGCRQPYVPPVGNTNSHYLVVDGVLISGDTTILTLSRTRNLGDSQNTNVPELNAQVSVMGTLGDVYPLYETSAGTYKAPNLPLSTNEKYQLQILTADGKKYLSDTITYLLTPPIDSISWRQDTTSVSNKLGVNIYANTHDPQNNTHYYRWEYVETWEYHPPYESGFYFDGSQVVLRNADQQVFYCWHNVASTNLFLASSASLSQDVIFEAPLKFIPLGDPQLAVRYSILVKQLALTREAYDYWTNLKKNTELTGSIFDPQPSQINGNLHCVSDPNEPVLGYIGASSAQEQRIFIDNRQTAHWGLIIQPPGCSQIQVPGDSLAYYFKSYIYIPLSSLPPPQTGYYASTRECGDCTVEGGTPVKPSFWQ